MKFLHLILLLASVFISISCEQKTNKLIDKEEETLKFNTWLDHVWDQQVARSPEWQAYLAIDKDKDKWDDYSEKNREEELLLTKWNLQVLQDSFKIENLQAVAQVSYELFEYERCFFIHV